MSSQAGVLTLTDLIAGKSLPTAGNAVIEIQPGFYLGSTEIEIGEDVTHSSQSFPFAALSILLEGYIDTDVPELGTIGPNTLLSIANSESRLLTSRFYGARNLRNVEIFVLPEWFEDPANRFAESPSFQRLRHSMEGPFRQTRRALDSNLRDLAIATLNARGTGAVAALRLEARALDLLAALADSFHEDERPSGLLRRDYDRVMEVRRLIEDDPASVASLTALAATHGVSASKLKRDFFVVFSTCVGGFVNEQRLALAYRLLKEGMSVSQAGYRAGYAHPTNFSTAFKRRYGIAPRDLRG